MACPNVTHCTCSTYAYVRTVCTMYSWQKWKNTRTNDGLYPQQFIRKLFVWRTIFNWKVWLFQGSKMIFFHDLKCNLFFWDKTVSLKSHNSVGNYVWPLSDVHFSFYSIGWILSIILLDAKCKQVDDSLSFTALNETKVRKNLFPRAFF